MLSEVYIPPVKHAISHTLHIALVGFSQAQDVFLIGKTFNFSSKGFFQTRLILPKMEYDSLKSILSAPPLIFIFQISVFELELFDQRTYYEEFLQFSFFSDVFVYYFCLRWQRHFMHAYPKVFLGTKFVAFLAMGSCEPSTKHFSTHLVLIFARMRHIVLNAMSVLAMFKQKHTYRFFLQNSTMILLSLTLFALALAVVKCCCE